MSWLAGDGRGADRGQGFHDRHGDRRRAVYSPLLEYLFTREGYTVATATNGVDGLERVRALRPTVVLLDIMMPGMDGYELCAQIKRDPDLADTYVIMLSAKGEQIDRERGLLGGADEYLTKPFSPREVGQRLRTLIDERNA